MDTIDMAMLESDDIYHNAAVSPVSRQTSHDESEKKKSGSSQRGGNSSSGSSGSRPKTASKRGASLNAALSSGENVGDRPYEDFMDEYDFTATNEDSKGYTSGNGDRDTTTTSAYDDGAEDEIAVISSSPQPSPGVKLGDAANASNQRRDVYELDEPIEDVVYDHIDGSPDRGKVAFVEEAVASEEDDDEDDLQYSGDLNALSRQQQQQQHGKSSAVMPSSAKKREAGSITPSGASKQGNAITYPSNANISAGATSNSKSATFSSTATSTSITSPRDMDIPGGVNMLGYDEEEVEFDDAYDDDNGGVGDSSPSVDAKPQSPRVPFKGMYSTEMMKPVLKVGGTTITLGEAKLYGLLDGDGEVKLNRKGGTSGSSSGGGGSSSAKKLQEAIERARALSNPMTRSDVAPPSDAKDYTFKPGKSAQAMKAMRSKECGYDFIDRLQGGNNDFLARLGEKHEKSMAKRELEALKQDYEARLDKLVCPNCSRTQSFDEFHQNKRKCQQCQVKYVKGSVFHPRQYAKKQQEFENMRIQRLKEIEDVMYPPESHRPKLNIIEGIDRPTLKER
jgi:ribosomal protein L37AE/L43A